MMIRNAYIDQIRHAKAVPMVSFEDTDNPIDISEYSLENTVIANRDLAAIWPTLQPTEREILHLWVIDGHSIAEVVRALLMPRGAVLSVVHRLRARIQAEFVTRSPDLFASGGAS